MLKYTSSSIRFIRRTLAVCLFSIFIFLAQEAQGARGYTLSCTSLAAELILEFANLQVACTDLQDADLCIKKRAVVASLHSIRMEMNCMFIPIEVELDFNQIIHRD